MRIVDIISLVIGGIGISVIIWGALLAFIEFLRLEYGGIRGRNVCRKRQTLRQHLGSYILIGLEFMIAADIVTTLIKPSLNELIVLGSIVAIRTVISYFLNEELKQSHSCGKSLE